MPWLTVTGTSSWRCGRDLYPPGRHEVDAETAQTALRAGIPRLIVTDDRPDLAGREGPLSKDDLAAALRGVQIAVVADEEEGVTELTPVPSEFPCPLCSAPHPSSGALARHIEFRHPTAA